MIYISPSLLAADFTKLGDEVKRIEEAGADYLHLDVMDLEKERAFWMKALDLVDMSIKSFS